MEMNKTVGVGVVGCGGISRLAHMPAIAATPGLKLVAIADNIQANLEAASAEFGVSETYDTIEELLASPSVDVVDICTPVWLHLPMVLAAAAAGKHVLCEKPLGRNAAEAAEMVAACERAGVTLTVMHQQRFMDGFQKIKELLDEEAIGQVVSIRARSGHAGPDKRMAVPGSAMGTWVFDAEKSGGGVLQDIGVHLLDVLTWLFGEVSTVTAELATLTRDVTVEDHAALLLTFASGVRGEAELSWSQVAGRNVVEIYGTDGTISFDRDRNELSLFLEADGKGWQVEQLAAQEWFHWHRFVIADVLASINGLTTTTATTGAEALLTMKITDAAYVSNSTGSRTLVVDDNSAR